MKKILSIRLSLIVYGCFLILICLKSSIYAQEVIIPPIPTEWTTNTQNSMNRSRENLIIHLKSYDKKVIDFNTRCALVRLDNASLMSSCQTESNQLDVESEIIDKERDQFLNTFHDNEKIYAAYVQSKKNEEILNPQSKTKDKPNSIVNGEETVNGAFGEKVAKPKLVPANPTIQGGTVIAADKQLLSVADEAKKGSQSDLGKNYDEGRGKNAGGLVFPSSGMSVQEENKLAEKHPELAPILKTERELKQKAEDLSKITDNLKIQISKTPSIDPKQKELVAALEKNAKEQSKVDGEKNMATFKKEEAMRNFHVDLDEGSPKIPDKPKN